MSDREYIAQAVTYATAVLEGHWAVAAPLHQPVIRQHIEALHEAVYLIGSKVNGVDGGHSESPGLTTPANQHLRDLELKLSQVEAERDDLQKRLTITSLAVPLTDEITDRIEELLKCLAQGQGFTLNGIAQLFVLVERRLADDWEVIGRERWMRKQVEARAEDLRAKLAQAEQALRDYGDHYSLCRLKMCADCHHSQYSHASVLEWLQCDIDDCGCQKFRAGACSCGLEAVLAASLGTTTKI